jgi:hypothetical protein
MKRFLTAAIASTVSCLVPVSAFASLSSGLLKAVYGDLSYPNLVFVQFAAPATKAPCATNPNVDYVLDVSSATGKTLYSMLLTAYAAQTPVKIGGYDTCNLAASVLAEDVRWVRAE